MLAAQHIVGAYRILRFLGAGGMGSVYEVEHTAMSTRHAMKVLGDQYVHNQPVRERFKREAQLMFHLGGHPHIVRATDVVESGETLALVVDLVSGGDLGQALDGRPGPLPWPQVWTILQPIVEAVTYAHERGVVHRDLKPENVLLQPNGSWPGTPLVADFGIAKVLGSDSATRTQARMGTACYGAPEQFRNAKDVGSEADVWALGMLAWRLVMGELPIDPEDNRALFMLYEGTTPVPRLQHVPDTVADAVGAALHVDPRQRPRNAGVLGKLLAVELQVLVAREPVESSREPLEHVVVAPEPIKPAAVSSAPSPVETAAGTPAAAQIAQPPVVGAKSRDVRPAPVATSGWIAKLVFVVAPVIAMLMPVFAVIRSQQAPVSPSRVLTEVCDGQDNDGNGATDDVVCGTAACTCGADGVATCPADCKVCPDEGDLAISVDDGGTKKVVCAHDYPAWGIVAEAPDTFTDNGDGTVTDSKTGLMWQLTVSDSEYSWASARQQCDELTLASKQDWRLPTQAELESLLYFAATSGPTIAAPFVAATPAQEFWSTSTFRDDSSTAWTVDYSTGRSSYASTASPQCVRCVRSSGLGIKFVASNNRYEVNAAAKTVLDRTTGLTWQQEPPGTGGSSSHAISLFNWLDARQYCASLELGGQSGWRLPGIVELRSLVRRNVSASPAMDAMAFPNTLDSDSSWFWSATQFQGGMSNAWFVSFYGGQSSNTNISNSSRVRCVR